MELKLILLLSSVALLTELSFQRVPPYGAMAMTGVVGRNKTKLCGSILRNAILYSCGASRWKREEINPPLPESVQTSSNKVLENTKWQSSSDPDLKQLQGDGLLDKEIDLSWIDFLEYYNDDKRNVPEVKEDPVWKSVDLENDPDLKPVQRDHPADAEPSGTDYLDLYNEDNKEDIVAGAEDAGWKSPGRKQLANPTGSDFPQAKVRRKRDFELEMAIKCCDEGCTAQDIASAFCLN